ncbi:Hot1 protein [Maudiozyma humilis]|uniref:Hot1 protein n=1 Tax=Maudiozyma humilis TaxID=51915 RepID=A0AAV5RSI0_MAUHU|nr:Hot1 protein [Kazachstania humilis]
MAARLAALESTVAQLPARLETLLQRHAAQQQAALEAAMQRRAAAHGSYAADVLDAVARVSAAHAMTAAPAPTVPPAAPPAAPPPTALPGGNARTGVPALALPSFTNRTKTFTLNPNGIKKRRRNGAPPGTSAGPAARHNTQDIAADVLGLPLGMPGGNPVQGNAPPPNAAPSAANAQTHPHGSPLPLALQMPLPLGMPVQVAAGPLPVPVAVPGAQGESAAAGHADLVGVNAAPNATANADAEGKPTLPEQEEAQHDTPDLVEEDGYQEDDESEHVVLPGPAVLPPGAKSAGTGIDTGTELSHSEEEYDEYEEEMEADGNFEEDEVDEDLERGGAKHAAKKRVMGKRRVKRTLPKDNNASATPNAPGSDAPPDSDINYTLLKAPNNVRTIWEEYVYGIGTHPSIRGLEEKYGNKWRLTKNRKTFSRRKRLYKFILAGIDRGRTADEMIRALEEKRLYKDENGEVKRRTIGWLQQSLTGI